MNITLPSSLRRGLPILLAILVFVEALSLVLVKTYREVTQAKTEATTSLRHQLVREQFRIEALLRQGGIESVSEGLAQLASDPKLGLVTLLNERGQVIFPTHSLTTGYAIGEVLPEFKETIFHQVQTNRRVQIELDDNNGNLFGYAPILLSPKHGEIRSDALGVLLIKYNLSAVLADLWHVVKISIFIDLVTALSLLLLLIFILHHWLSKPLAHLQDAVDRIGRSDFSTVVNIGGRGELAVLADSINHMQATLNRSSIQLRASEANLAITLNSIGDAVIATDTAGLITRMNPTAERLTSWQMADAIGQPLTAVFNTISAETRLPSVNPVQLVMESGHVVGLANHTALLARDGQEYQIADSAAPIRDATDAIVGVVVVFSDVTEKYQAEEALRERDQRFRDLVNSTDGMVWEADASTFNFVLVSDNAVRLLGYPETDWLQPGFWADHIYPEDRDSAVQFCVDSTGRHENHAFEYRFFAADGRLLWLRDIVRVIAENGKPRWLRGLIFDITERKLAEEALRAAKDHLQATLNAIPDLLFEADANGRVLSYHAHSSDLLAAPPEVFMSKCFAEVLPPAATEVCMNALREAATKGWVTGATYSLTLPQGETWFELSGAAMPIVAGETPRFILLARDITERIQTQQALQSSIREKTALLHEVHHRVKNNLQVITSLLRLEAGRSTIANTKEVLGYMRGRIRTMAQLHESLYRADTFASVDLGVYLGQVATQAFKTQELHRDSVRLTLNLGSVQAGMDQATAAGLLLNELISNGLKHGFPEGRTGEVGVELQPAHDQDNPPDGRWCLRVRDTGVGLPQDFEDKRKASLGLQLVTDLSNQLGGTLVIDSAPGQGARFSVVFTVQEPAPLVMPT